MIYSWCIRKVIFFASKMENSIHNCLFTQFIPATHDNSFHQNMSWLRPSQRMFNSFNPLLKDKTGHNYYETYFEYHIQTLSKLLDVGDTSLFDAYLHKLASKWSKVSVDYFHIAHTLIIKLYSLGVRNPETLSLESLINYTPENKVYYYFMSLLYGQTGSIQYNEKELFNEQVIQYINASQKNLNTVLKAFINELGYCHIKNLRPFPACLTKFDNETSICLILKYYKEKFFDYYHDHIGEYVSDVIKYSIINSITVPEDILNEAYQHDRLLPHLIISNTSDPETCISYLMSLNDFTPEVKNDDGRTALMNFIVKYKGMPTIGKVLHNPEIKDNDGKTCQDLWIRLIGKDSLPDPIRVQVYTRLTCGCSHTGSYEYEHDSKLYCEECAKDILDKEKVFMTNACPICYDTYTKETTFGRYKHCAHVICENCAKETTECPFCRK